MRYIFHIFLINLLQREIGPFRVKKFEVALALTRLSLEVLCFLEEEIELDM